MKSFLVGCVIAVVVAVGAAVVLDRVDESSAEAYTTIGARV
jgi:hypothetical protein